MGSMRFVKKTGKRNIYPNKYKISYTDFRGNRKTSTMSGLTAEEAMNRFRSKDITNKNVSAKLIKRK